MIGVTVPVSSIESLQQYFTDVSNGMHILVVDSYYCLVKKDDAQLTVNCGACSDSGGVAGALMVFSENSGLISSLMCEDGTTAQDVMGPFIDNIDPNDFELIAGASIEYRGIPEQIFK